MRSVNLDNWWSGDDVLGVTTGEIFVGVQFGLFLQFEGMGMAVLVVLAVLAVLKIIGVPLGRSIMLLEELLTHCVDLEFRY